MRKSFMDMAKGLSLLLFTVFAVGLASCSESDDVEDEFANWKERNDTYFNNVYNQAKSAIASGSQEWKIFRNWSLNEDMATKAEDHIVVQVLEKGTGSGCPLYTDSVMVHYRGHYIPTTHYPEGYVFDQSYTGDYQPELIKPSSFAVNRMVDGFTTALTNMHIGDRWRVYVPYMLGYGLNDTSTTVNGTTISYRGSTVLVFDLTLVAYFHTGAYIPAWEAKPSGVWIDE